MLDECELDYPAELRDLRHPPRRLYLVGHRHQLGKPRVAIVGTRTATAYGERIARVLAAAFARAGVAVVSGMARGIDAAAHRGAMEAGGATIAILGTGVDVPYPAGHRRLHREIAESGLVVSEEEPGARAARGCFPRRNRLIAALAPLTIVVEAGQKSGALNTATQAVELGRSVGAVPGPIDAPQSFGTNRLLRDGAQVIGEVADALSLMNVPLPRVPAVPHIEGAAERAVWEALAAGPMDIETLARHSELPARECVAAVTTLELTGTIECGLTGEVRRR